VRDGDLQHISWLEQMGERRRIILYPEMNPLATVLEMVILQQCPGKETGFTQNLEAVADTNNQFTPLRKILHRSHHRGKPGYSSCPKIITIGKASRKDNTVVSRKVSLLMPDIADFLPQNILQSIIAVSVTPGTRKDNNAKFHINLGKSLLPLPGTKCPSNLAGVSRNCRASLAMTF